MLAVTLWYLLQGGNYALRFEVQDLGRDALSH